MKTLPVVLTILSLLSLGGCGGGQNIYAAPLGDFEQAVNQTGHAVIVYDGLERKLAHLGSLSATALEPSAVIAFNTAKCRTGKTAAGCVLMGGDQQPLFVFSDTPSKTMQMMERIETYAALLADVAGAVSAEELHARQKIADRALSRLKNGLGALRDGQAERGLPDFKSDAMDALTDAYLQRQRRKLLTALVKDADPVIQDGAKALGAVLEDTQASFIETQAFRIDLQVQNFNNLGLLLKNATGATATAEAQVLRREALERLVRDSAQVQGVAQIGVMASFDDMAKAHSDLLQVLELSSSDIGIAIEAIQAFAASSKKASDAFSVLQGIM